MKNNQFTEPLNNQPLLENDYRTPPITCAQSQTAQYACLNKNCERSAFLCRDKSCSCRKEHRTCLIVELETITNGLMGKIVPVDDMEMFILQAIDKLTDMLSDFREKTINNIKTKFQFCGLSEHEKQFMDKLSRGEVAQITGKHLWNAHLNFSPESNITSSKQNTLNSIQKIFTQMETKIQSHCAEINKLIDLFQQQSRKLGEKLKSQSSKNHVVNSNLALKFACSASKIITNFDEFITLQSFFYPKIIKKVKLLYQASNEKFQVGKFHEKCDNATDTLTLCETQFGKKFGGYTPLAWASPASYQYKVDEKEESFIFSLTHKDKFTLVKKTHSVRLDVLYGPTFGNGQDFIIRNKANEASDSTANINSAYYNSNYKKNDRASWEKFCGNSSCSSFKLKEWQVWKIEFE